MTNYSQLLPILSTMAGSTLTLKNWQQAGIKMFSYRLEDLLMKPGLTILKGCSLNKYTGFSTPISLNLVHNFTSKNGFYTIKNRFDGGKITLSVEDLVLLINQLKPTAVLLPLDCALFQSNWSELDKEIIAYYPSSIENDIIQSRYFFFDDKQDFNHFLSAVQQEKRQALILGNFNTEQLMAIAPFSTLIETNTPAQEGYNGYFFFNSESISILETSWTHEHCPLDATCTCITCSSKLTRAYLHHLYQKTPLLAQRYFIAHNVHYYQKHLENSSFTSR